MDSEPTLASVPGEMIEHFVAQKPFVKFSPNIVVDSSG